LENAIVFCEVRSWITGQRLVSLPFSDHCDPLVDSSSEQADILAGVREQIERKTYRYAELRPTDAGDADGHVASDLRPAQTFHRHTLSLDPPLDALFRGFHKDCIQRKVRRAEREGLRYEAGRSDTLLRKFHRLLMRTRRRHGLPPQPLKWFQHLMASMGDELTIRVASKDERPVAAMLTLAFRDTLTYKYGGSDERFSHLGGTPFLFWRTIQEAKARGISRLDLGRSDLDNAGLVTFKNRLGAQRTTLNYYRLGSGLPSVVTHKRRGMQMLQRFVAHMPDTVLLAAGRVLYRHIG
jgi:CelD/BcsL family acetyltransferase involved in cellulose biosynthesis